MAHKLFRALTFSNVCSLLALTIALGTGTAYAANTIGSDDIVNKSIRSVDIKNGQVKKVDLGAGAVDSSKVADGTITNPDLGADAVTSSKVLIDTLTSADLATNSVTASEVLDASLTGDDIANRTVNMDDIDGANLSGSIDVGAIADGRCTTITGSVTGAEPGDVAVLTTDGILPNGMTVSAQRALTDAVHIKVCNLTGATSAAITDLPVRIITFH